MLETICEVMTDAYKRNWITSRDGNASIRHQDRDHFYVTPTGVRKQTLQPDQFKKISIHGLLWQEEFYSDISAKLKHDSFTKQIERANLYGRTFWNLYCLILNIK